MEITAISGWGLVVGYDVLSIGGELKANKEAGYNCNTSDCSTRSIIPQPLLNDLIPKHPSYEHFYKWEPPEGSSLRLLGCYLPRDMEQHCYYLLKLSGDIEIFLELVDCPHQYSKLYTIRRESMPESLLQ